LQFFDRRDRGFDPRLIVPRGRLAPPMLGLGILGVVGRYADGFEMQSACSRRSNNEPYVRNEGAEAAARGRVPS